MTISSNLRKAGPFSGNGATIAFPFAYKVFATSDVVVTKSDGVTETTLTLTTDYTVALNADQNANPGGTVTYPASGSPLPVGQTLTLSSSVPELQQTSITNQGGFYPKIIEDALDRLTIFVQQFREILGRSLRFPVSDPALNITLPTAAQRASKVLGFDASGAVVTYSPSSAVTDAGSVNYVPASGPTAGVSVTVQTWLDRLLTAGTNLGAALVGWIQSGTGAVFRWVQDKLRESVSVKDFGAVGDGVTDDTAAVQAALNSLPNGGTVIAPPGKYYLASSITVPANVTFKGPCESIGSARVPSFDFTAVNGSIYLSNTATINLSQGASLSNFLVINKNLVTAYPLANATAALNAVAAYAGTAITGSSAEDIYIHNLRILGFAQAISTNLCDRIKIEWIDIDCTAGILTNDVYDISRIYNVHAWPFVTYGYSFSTQSLVYYRSGSAFKITGHFDGASIVNCFAYGYFTGYDIQATTGIELIACWCEGGGASYIAGQIGYKFSVAGDQTNMLGCGVDTCDIGVYVNYAGIKFGMSGCQLHANKTSFKVDSATDVAINDNHFYYAHVTGGGSPDAWPAAYAAIHLNGVGGQVSISNNYVYGSLLEYGVSIVNYNNNLLIVNNRFINCTTGILVDAISTGNAVIQGNGFAGTTTPYTIPTGTFKNNLTILNNIGMASDPLGNVVANLSGQPAHSDVSFGGGNGPRRYRYYAQGTPAAPTIVLNTNTIGSDRYHGYDGAAFQLAGQYRFSVDGAPAAGSMPGVFIVSTTPTGTVASVDRNATDNGGHFKPLTDNVYQVGLSGLRWAAIWAANGTIQTSDARTKKDITNSALGLDFINALRPVSYTWIEGSKRVIRQEVNEDGSPGEIITESIPGTRTHWGLIAQEVKVACDAAGVDFGGWVLTDKDNPDSQQALRYDQFVAPLIKAVQELTARVQALEAR